MSENLVVVIVLSQLLFYLFLIRYHLKQNEKILNKYSILQDKFIAYLAEDKKFLDTVMLNQKALDRTLVRLENTIDTIGELVEVVADKGDDDGDIEDRISN